MASQQHPHRRPKVCHVTMHMLSAPHRLTLPHVSPRILHGFGVRGTEYTHKLSSCPSPSARDASHCSTRAKAMITWKTASLTCTCVAQFPILRVTIAYCSYISAHMPCFLLILIAVVCVVSPRQDAAITAVSAGDLFATPVHCERPFT